MLIQYINGGKAWRGAIYRSCIAELESSLKKSTFPDIKIDGLNLFGKITQDKRISGYLIRNSVGAVILTVGQTPDGKVLASFFDEENVTEGKEVNYKRRSTILNVTSSTENDSFDIIRNETVIEKKKTFLPDFIDNNDILGTISVNYLNTTVFTVDILSYSPRTYEYTKMIINPILKSLIFSLPLSALIAFLGAYLISRRNSEYIESVRISLKRLSNGETLSIIPQYKYSELNEIGKAITELDKSLQSNRRSRNTWLQSISHDLNTPVTGMKIIIDGLVDGFFDADTETLKELKKQNDTLSDRIKRVIDYSTLIADTKINMEETDTDSLMESISIEKKENANLVFTKSTDTIICDAAQIRRAINELIDNARNVNISEIVKDSSVTDKITIDFSMDKDNCNYKITVKNNGHLPAEIDYNALFEPWTKGTYSRSGSGNGLGLAIVGAILHLHGGKAEIKEENGTVVTTLIWGKKIIS